MAYIVRDDIDAVFGKLNVDKWADIENDGVSAHKAARVARSIVYAEACVNDKMRGGLYAVPVVDSVGGTPELIKDAAAKIAGYWLYTSRGMVDSEDPDPVKSLYEAALNTLAEVRSGVINLDATPVHSTAPSVVDLTTT